MQPHFVKVMLWPYLHGAVSYAASFREGNVVTLPTRSCFLSSLIS
jgi:hypothetical protein